jgi:alpha-tubulin suppressor-like RCC1 family protein
MSRLLSLLVLALSLAGVAAAPASASTAERWGIYLGEPAKRDKGEQTVPTPVTLPAPVVQIATSNSANYALLDNGNVYAWGAGVHGQLGDGQAVDSLKTPVQVRFPAGVQIAYLPTDAMPYDTGLAVDTNGDVWGWGYNGLGELCLGNEAMQLTPTMLPLSHVTAVAGAGDHALYDSSGTVYACGANLSGDLGDDSTTPSNVPVEVLGLPSHATVSTLVASWEGSGALLSNGEYLDWGYNGLGELGDGNTTDSSIPVHVSLPLPVTQVTQGGSYVANGQTLVMLSDGSLRAWGANTWGQLGNGNTKTQLLPVRIDPPTGVTYQTLASGGSTSYAISTTGNLYGWGSGKDGALGLSTRKPRAAKDPVLIESGISLISATAGNVASAE